jgi:dinuclear metal center YbgI/SA1388 family protein
VTRILLAIDPVREVVDEALIEQADMIITHHPLFLHGVHSVAPVSARGKVVHELITHGRALYCAHTNADHAHGGVSDALAQALGVSNLVPIDPFNDSIGTGRKGVLAEPTTLASFAERVERVLPATAQGVKFAGDPHKAISTVAVCGGAGDSLLPLVAGTVDVYVTSDLRHHRAQDFLTETSTALIDTAHWASEWLWLPTLADQLTSHLDVQVHVSTICTDPWHREGNEL